MSKTPCTNTAPIAEDLANKASGRGREGFCPECGAFLVILDSGVFRQHGRRLKEGSPKIAETIAARKAELAPAPVETETADEDLAAWPTETLPEAPAAPAAKPVRKEIAEIVVGDKLGNHGLDLEVVEIRSFPCYQQDVAAMLEGMGREPIVYSLKCRVTNPDEAVENGFPRSYLTREDGAAYWTIQGNTHPANVYTIRQ